MPDLSVSPASVALGAHQACRFSVNSTAKVTWTIAPPVGEKIVGTAQVDDGHATGSLEVTDNATWVRVLAWYAMSVGLVLGFRQTQPRW